MLFKPDKQIGFIVQFTKLPYSFCIDSLNFVTPQRLQLPLD
jgi:hypothetical protein